MTVDTSAEAIGRSIAELMSWLTGPDSGQNDGLVTAANQLAALSAERDQWLTRAAAAVSLLPDDMRVGELQAAVKNLMERDALMPQRDAARTEAALLEVRAQRAEADRDRLAAEVARLREALTDLMTWFPDRPSAPEWRLPGGRYGADEAVQAARAALAGEPQP